MKTGAVKNKLIYFAFLLSCCIGLMLVGYFGFLQTVNIDVMLGIQFVYTGESGEAQVSAVSKTDDLNQRIQEFMQTVTYTIEPSEKLANGDTITVTALYDADMAVEYHFQPVNTRAEFRVEGLPERYASLAEIPEAYIQESREAASRALKAEGQEPVYGAFLQGKTAGVRDRILWMYQLEDGWYEIVLVPDVNNAQVVNRKAISTQQVYLSSKEQENRDFAGYVRRVFEADCNIEELTESTVPLDTPQD